MAWRGGAGQALCTEMCKFMGKELCETRPAAGRSEEAEFTQLLTHESTLLNTCNVDVSRLRRACKRAVINAARSPRNAHPPVSLSTQSTYRPQCVYLCGRECFFSSALFVRMPKQ